MKKTGVRLAGVVILAALIGSLTYFTAAASTVKLTITASSAFLRSGPSLLLPRVRSVFKGEIYTVIGRTADNVWVQLDVAGAPSETWTLAAIGTLSGDMDSVPINSGAPLPPTLPAASAEPVGGAAGAAATPIPASNIAAVSRVFFTVTAKSANLRAGPSTLTDKVGALFSGEKASVLGRTADAQWLQVSPGGLTGWIIASAGKLNLPAGMLPITDNPPPAAPAAPAASGSVTPNSTTTAFSGILYTVTAQSVNLRANPTTASNKLANLTSGQSLPAVGRSTDGRWTQVASDGIVGWVIASAGKLNLPAELLPITDRPLPIVPLTPTEPPPPRSPEANLRPEWLPAITPKMRAIYLSYRAGKNLNMFTVAGDCNSDNPDYLVRVVAGRFDLTGYSNLNGVVGQFAGGLVRHSLATHGGLSAGAMFDAAWANPTYCRKSYGNTEGPLNCELRVSQASIIFLAVGTGDHPQWQNFEASYRQMIEYALKAKVLPVLMTKADDIEALVDGAPSGYINSVIRKLAAEYEVPLMDFSLATRDLPNRGLLREDLPFHLSPAGFDMQTLFMLQMLQLISGR